MQHIALAIRQYDSLKRVYTDKEVFAFDLEDGRYTFIGEDARTVHDLFGMPIETNFGRETASPFTHEIEEKKSKFAEHGKSMRVITQPHVISRA